MKITKLVHEANQILKDASQPYTEKFQTIAQKLESAYAIDPQRIDLLFSAASAWISINKSLRAIALYEKILSIEPDNSDALSYITTWNRYLNNHKQSKHYLRILIDKDPRSAKHLKYAFFVIDSVLHEPILTELPAHYPRAHVAIVILGYALNQDGSMHSVLIDRLKAAQQLAIQIPQATIIPTGGRIRDGESEGENMTAWLEKHGIDHQRIQEENFAQDTLSNALYSMPIIAQSHAKNIIIVSSASHVRRAHVIFSLTAIGKLAPDCSFTTIASGEAPDPELTKEETREIYRDALRSLGLWSYRSAPLLYW